MAFLSTSDSIIVRATLTDKGRKLLSRGKFKIAKFALGDDEIDYQLLDPEFFNDSVVESDGTSRDYKPAVVNSLIFEAPASKNKGIRYGLNSYDEGTLYLSDEEAAISTQHAHLLYIPTLKMNHKLKVSPTVSGSVYYFSVNDETTEQLDSISKTVRPGATDNSIFNFLTTNKLENTKIIIESGIETLETINEPYLKNRRHKITKKFLLDHDYFIYADNKFFREFVGIGRNSKFENFPSGEVIANFKTGQPAPAISIESEFDSYATFILAGIPNLIAQFEELPSVDMSTDEHTGFKYSAHEGPRGTVVAFNPLIDQKLQTTSTGDRDFRYTEYGYTDQIVFSELPTKKFDYIDTTIYVIGGTTNSRVQVPIRLIRYVGI